MTGEFDLGFEFWRQEKHIILMSVLKWDIKTTLYHLFELLSSIICFGFTYLCFI